MMMVPPTKTLKATTLVYFLSVPIYIGLHFNWWMGVISFILNFLIGRLFLFVFYNPDKPYIPYLIMLIIAMILISVSHLIVG